MMRLSSYLTSPQFPLRTISVCDLCHSRLIGDGFNKHSVGVTVSLMAAFQMHNLTGCLIRLRVNWAYFRDLKPVICYKPSCVFEVKVSKCQIQMLCVHNFVHVGWWFLHLLANLMVSAASWGSVSWYRDFATMIPIGQLYLSAIFVSLPINIQNSNHHQNSLT